MLIRRLEGIPALDRMLRLTPHYRMLCGLEDQLPCQRTWYRRFRQLGSLIQTLKIQLLTIIFGSCLSIFRIAASDATALSAYGRHASKKQKKYKPGDRDAVWSKTVSKGWFQGYKVHSLSTTRPLPLPLAWHSDTAESQEAKQLEGLLEEVQDTMRLSIRYLACDKSYDSEDLFQMARNRKVFLAADLRAIPPPKPGSRKATVSRPFRKRWAKSSFARYVSKLRSDIERMFSRIKGTFRLDPLPVRHKSNVIAYTHLCFLGYLALVAFNVAHGRDALKLQDIMNSY